MNFGKSNNLHFSRPSGWLWTIAGCLAAGAGLIQTTQAVILYDTGDITRNTTAPTGALLNSGWQYEGQWGNFLGTAIAPNLFITAKHVNGDVGDTFTYGGVAYTTTASYTSANSDLRIWKVNGTFSSYAPLYTGSSEAGHGLVVIGRGTQRGTAVYNSVNELTGWKWGTADHAMRWGQNTVDGVVDGGANLGQMLSADFDRVANKNEAHLSSGDSGGAVFIQDGGVWKLAGINYGVDAYFSVTGASGSFFNAAIFDAGGLYYGNDAHSQYVPANFGDVPSSFYATRISSNSSWINGLIATVPEPSTYLAGISALGMLGMFCWRGRK